MTPLMATAAAGPLENVRTLLDLGADPLATDYQGGAALHHAVVRMDSAAEVARLLLAAGADVNARLSEGITPLMQAAGFGTSDTVAALIEAGAALGRGPDLPAEDPGIDYEDDFDLEAFLDEERFAQEPDSAQLAYERLLEAEL